MNLSIKKAMRSYFAGKLRLGIFWFALFCVAGYAQIELFYGPLDWFYERYPYITGIIGGLNLTAFGISLGYLLTRLVTRLNYTGRLRSAEVLYREDGAYQLIRRAETNQDYFATLDIDPAAAELGLKE